MSESTTIIFSIATQPAVVGMASTGMRADLIKVAKIKEVARLEEFMNLQARY